MKSIRELQSESLAKAIDLVVNNKMSGPEMHHQLYSKLGEILILEGYVNVLEFIAGFISDIDFELAETIRKAINKEKPCVQEKLLK